MSKAPPAPDVTRIFNTIKSKLNSFVGSAAKSAGASSAQKAAATGLGNLGTYSIVLGFSGLVGYTLYKSVYFVQGGHRAVKFNAITGMFDRTYGEGANLCIPYLETPIIFDIRSKPTEVITSSGSKDLQMVNMAVRVLYRPSADHLHTIYRELGVNYPETVLPSLINEIIKAVIAQFNASDLLTRRPEVTNRISVQLQERAQRFNIDISDVSITQMSFGKEYTNAVEAKQIAQQMAERAKFRVDQAKQEKLGAIVLAEGEAESARLIGQAVQTNPAFVELRKLEAARAIAKTLGSKGKGQYYLNAETLLIDLETAPLKK